MNYIDAHSICTKYFDVFAKTPGIYKPISSLHACGASNKKMVEDAIILFLAHSILWNDLSSEQTEGVRALLLQLDSFVDDDFAREHATKMKVIERSKSSAVYRLFHKKEVEEAMNYLMANTKINLYDDTRVDDAVTHMNEYKKVVYIPKMQALLRDEKKISHDEYWYRFLNLVGDYSDEVCNFAKIATTPSDYYLFMSFELMQEWVNDENVGKHYLKYRNYILSHFDNWKL